ncbi:dihydrofolate reductase family protein [Herbiconiux sp. CPCC 205763]|uniref:Dihydrofolate reductase family protein n=1 Tax=Herbiconiux aconitum TaxID=2970913 RepID=A0ABT2GT82_9MICO|nr:dihydrofolate reductase family protein [Herbiconiux aconitum]MCS5718772.1 dihydrofolate reductase family protein [Herbiconiux aconitum]
MTGRIQIDLFSTLDGVQQAPGGPDEDTDGGFAFGGWQAPVMDEADGEQIMAGIRAMDALLLGRRTYDIFAGFWPRQLDGADSEIARKFDGIPKYVASRGTPALSWRDSHLIGGDLATEVAALRERHSDIHVIGSIDFARSLVAEGLFDQLNLWVYPIVLGAGKRLFPDDGLPTTLELLAPPTSSPKGTLFLRYGPGNGAPTAGDMSRADRGV